MLKCINSCLWIAYTFNFIYYFVYFIKKGQFIDSEALGIKSQKIRFDSNEGLICSDVLH